MRLIRLLEPLWWLLFGAGGFAAALVLPSLLLVVGILFPLGLLGDETATFNRMRTLFANPVGKLVLIALLSLVFWHAAHHLRHLSLDLGLHRLHAPVSYLLYGGAALGTLATVLVVLSLKGLGAH